MKVRREFKAIDLDGSVNKTGIGEMELENPVMIYAQIPIEREKYFELVERCKEEKISIFDLLEQALY